MASHEKFTNLGACTLPLLRTELLEGEGAVLSFSCRKMLYGVRNGIRGAIDFTFVSLRVLWSWLHLREEVPGQNVERLRGFACKVRNALLNAGRKETLLCVCAE